MTPEAKPIFTLPRAIAVCGDDGGELTRRACPEPPTLPLALRPRCGPHPSCARLSPPGRQDPGLHPPARGLPLGPLPQPPHPHLEVTQISRTWPLPWG